MKLDCLLRFPGVLILSSLTACGGGGATDLAETCLLGVNPATTVQGAITFDRIALLNSGALDFNNISQQPAKNIIVEAVCGSETISALTDDNGQYILSIPSGTKGIFIRAKAQMIKTGIPSWQVTVTDASQAGELVFALDSGRFNVNATAVTKNLHAPSGFDGVGYSVTSVRSAAPFAILDTINKSMQLVLSANTNTVFPALDVKWSPLSTNGTFYVNNQISVLGHTSDTDEFDEHVIAHEWGHYYQDAFSRDDSIGGVHSIGDILDIRVAFSEGFGNAFSAMVTGDPVYKDSQAITSPYGLSFNIESNTCTNKGWYNECSVQSVLYDFFDDINEANDVFSLGFDEIHQVMTSNIPISNSLTSLFSFINSFKKLSAVVSADVDTLLAEQSIDSITDDFGSGVSSGSYVIDTTDILPIYDTRAFPLTDVCPTADNIRFTGVNGLGAFRFIRFTAASSGLFRFEAVRTGGITASDPDMVLYQGGTRVAFGSSIVNNTENFNANLVVGKQYVLEVLEYTYVHPDVPYNPDAVGAVNNTCFTVNRTQI